MRAITHSTQDERVHRRPKQTRIRDVKAENERGCQRADQKIHRGVHAVQKSVKDAKQPTTNRIAAREQAHKKNRHAPYAEYAVQHRIRQKQKADAPGKDVKKINEVPKKRYSHSDTRLRVFACRRKRRTARRRIHRIRQAKHRRQNGRDPVTQRIQRAADRTEQRVEHKRQAYLGRAEIFQRLPRPNIPRPRSAPLSEK